MAETPTQAPGGDRYQVQGGITNDGVPVIIIRDFLAVQTLSMSLEAALWLSGHISLVSKSLLEQMTALAQERREQENKPRLIVPGGN